MDEATSNLDSITEKAIERTISEHTKGITTFIIAHRLSTIMRCDKIFVMDKGEFVESGSHKELIDKKDFTMIFGKNNCLKQREKPLKKKIVKKKHLLFLLWVDLTSQQL